MNFLSVFANADSVSPRREPDTPFGQDDIGRKVAAAVAAMAGGPDDRARQEVDALRADDRASAEIARVYSALPLESYELRWILMNLAASLAGPASLQLLDQVIRAPLPPERTGDTHRFPTVTRELMIRIRTLEGVRSLAAAGNADARASLLEYLKSPHFSIRKSAALGLLALPDGKQYRTRIAEALPTDEGFVLELREAKVEDLGVIRLEAAAGVQKAASPAPKLFSAGPQPEKQLRRAKGPPTI